MGAIAGFVSGIGGGGGAAGGDGGDVGAGAGGSLPMVSDGSPSMPVVPVQPDPIAVAGLSGVPADTGAGSTPVDPSLAAAPATPSTHLVLINPQDSAGPVNYVLDGNAYTLAAGSVQELSLTAPGVIEFDRGIGGAEGRYTLASGSYRFSVSDSRWELKSITYEVILDNRANDHESYYLRDGREESVPAGGTRKLTDVFPIQVSFDQGNGGNVATRSLDQDGATYRIALWEGTNSLDLIPTSQE
jgi:hypothetical protein